MNKTDTKKSRRKRFIVGIWQNLTDYGGNSTGLQIWNVQSAKTKKTLNLDWSTSVTAKDEDEALKLGQEEYRKRMSN